MGLFKKKATQEPVLPVNEVHDDSTGTAADVEAVMKKYDRESNTRVWEGAPKVAISILMAAFSLYCIIDTVFLTTLTEIRLPVFVGLVLLLGFLTFPARKGDDRVNHLPWYDVLLIVCGSGAYFFYAANAMTVIQLSSRIMKEPLYMVIGFIGIIALIELCRRCVGIPILCVAGVLLVYTFVNLMGTRALTADQLALTLSQVIRTMFYTTNGIFGGPISVCAKFIVVFIIFGAFLERTGIANFFISLANAVAGAAPGGPAKVAVISSALCGMVSGSSVGNTVTTGSVTIPMMKKTGYKGEFAGAVEAAASTGGQIMPPIMGAAAFLMAEFTGEPYSQIAVRAILPAVLYFTGIYIAVHLEAKKLGLQGIPRDQLPRLGYLMKRIYLLFPLVLLVALVSTNTYTMAYSAALAIVATIVVSLPDIILDGIHAGGARRSGLDLGRMVFGALEGGAKGILLKDAHDSARNIKVSALPEEVRILRGWTGDLLSMMSGLDTDDFGAVLFTGYHAWASCPGNPLSHTMNLRNEHVLLNGVLASEFLINTYTAGYYGVPVAFLAGDQDLCTFARELIPEMVTVPVNKGVGGGVLSIHPDVAVERIRAGAKEAVEKAHKCKVPMPDHFDSQIRFREHKLAYSKSFYPGATLEEGKTVCFSTDDWYEMLRFYHFVLSDG